MAENFPTESRAESGENERDNKLSRIQEMIASLFKRKRSQDYEITEDTISAKSAIQFVSSTILTTQTDDDEL
jgi:hypothetical protein